MPELAECETVVRDLRAVVIGKNIDWLNYSSLETRVQKIPSDLIVSRQIHDVERFGKYIVFRLDDGFLISHLRMTGQWLYETPVVDKHYRWSLGLSAKNGDKSILLFRDVRKFGTLVWSKYTDNYLPLSRLGVDGLDLNKEECRDFVKYKASLTSRPIKTFLLDQGIIAGSGNIYTVESMFASRIHPETPADRVDIDNLCMNMYGIFCDAVEDRGTSLSDYVDGNGEKGSYQHKLKVYGRAGKPCFVCSTKIEKIVQAGRSTFYCPECQGE